MRPDLEIEAGGRQLLQSLNLPACPYPNQVQRLGQALVRDARRFLRHTIHLPKDFVHVRPLQTISWTSERNGYDGKLFEVGEQVIDLYSYEQQASLREVDPADYDPQAYLEGGTVAPIVTPPVPFTVPEPLAEPWAISDATGARRPAIRITWGEFSATAVEVEVSQGGSLVISTSVPAEQGVTIISDGILGAIDYSVRVRPTPDGRPVAWSAALAVTTSDVRLQEVDLEDLAVSTDKVAESAITESQSASAAQTAANNSATPTVLLTLDFDGNFSPSGSLIYGVRFSVSVDPSTLPVDARVRLWIGNGILQDQDLINIPRGWMIDTGGKTYVNTKGQRDIRQYSQPTITLEMKNMGGAHLNDVNLWGLLPKK